MSQFTSDEFLNSFLQEASEYLQTIQHGLLVLDRSFQDGRAKRGRKAGGVDADEDAQEQINTLLRALHSLKGIAGMVGLAPAADLSHAMESVLRPIQQGLLENSATRVDKLIEASKLLEATVQTVRDGREMPSTQDILTQLETLAPRPAAPNLSAEMLVDAGANSSPASGIAIPLEVAAHLKDAEWKKIRNAFASGDRVALVTYEPTQGQIQEGKNVNYVREALLRTTRLIKAAPVIRSGAVRFVFVVACKTIPPSEELAFLDWQPVQEIPAPAADQSEGPILAFTPGLSQGLTQGLVQHTAGLSSHAASPVSVRVDLSRMDSLMQLVGDLVVTRARISDLLPKLAGAPPPALESLEETTARMERQVHHLRDAVMHARLVPLSEMFARIPLTVRDLARQTGKHVQLVVDGGDTEIDKALVERLTDPLMHLVRNAVTHGIELPEQRAVAGKPSEGTIHLRGKTQGDRVVVTIEDDGAGVQTDKVRHRAQQLGWLKEGAPLSDQEILEFLCRPGFSTQENADMAAGRGMGMNIVSETVAALGGSFSLENCPAEGAVFTIHLPLTLTIINAFIIEVGAERYAVPQSVVNEVIEVLATETTRVSELELVRYRGSAIPLVSLQKKYHLPATRDPHPERRGYGLVVGEKEKQAAILVDRVVGLRETVVHPLTDPLITEPSVSGVTELGDGSIALILDCFELVGRR